MKACSITLFLFVTMLLFTSSVTAQHDQSSVVYKGYSLEGEFFKIRFDASNNNTTGTVNVERIDVKLGTRTRSLYMGKDKLYGDIGRMKYGKNKEILWNWTNVISDPSVVTGFEVFGTWSSCPVEPEIYNDIAIGSGGGVVGIVISTIGLATVLKKGNVDNSITNPDDDPITYYYTYCDPNSSFFDNSLVELNTDNTSPCDTHLEAARSIYRQGQTLLVAGTVLTAAGAYIFWKKPLYNRAMLKYRRENSDCLTLTPTFDFQQSVVWGDSPGVGLRLTYQFH